MWNRAELKARAKKRLFENYWKTVLITLLLTFITGGISINFTNKITNSTTNGAYDKWSNEEILDIGNQVMNNYNIQNIINEIRNYIANVSPIVWITSVMAAMVIAIASILITIFVVNPLSVGCIRWYIKNRIEKPELGEAVYPFKKGYLNTVKIMFCKNLFIALWSLLFIIPGIIKAYEYRMVPYLLAENPEMSMSEAFYLSKKLMDGNKFDTFVLDFSFILWSIAGTFFMGLVGILFVNPYVQLTNTELYVKLCMRQE